MSGFQRSYIIDCGLFVSKLINITINIGLELEYLLPLFGDHSKYHTPLQAFYHNFFIPTSCHRLVLKGTQYEIDNLFIKILHQKVIIYPKVLFFLKKEKSR